ncbi:type II secretion system protein [Candidatus Dependentiae bacterium]|nr:type II secretion system protein [Candidatus Dependentiae bacterium]
MVKKKGFTLTEVLIVLVIVSLISVFFFFFLKILTQTTKFSLQKSEKSIIINTMVNLIREDLYSAKESDASTGRLEIINDNKIIYHIDNCSLFRNEKLLTNREIFKVTRIDHEDKDGLVKIMIEIEDAKMTEKYEILVKPRR